MPHSPNLLGGAVVRSEMKTGWKEKLVFMLLVPCCYHHSRNDEESEEKMEQNQKPSKTERKSGPHKRPKKTIHSKFRCIVSTCNRAASHSLR